VALARLLDFLASARPADARAVVAALPEAELIAAVEAGWGHVSLPVREHILADGGSAVLVALARQLTLHGGEASGNTAARILTRFDPAADAVFFEADPDSYVSEYARRMILRHRQGPDGHAVIPPRVKQSLLAAAAAAGGRPHPGLLNNLAEADDPDLVLAAVPYARDLAWDRVAGIITTLDAHGRRAEAKRHPELWAGRGRDFKFLGVRRFGGLRNLGPMHYDFSVEPDESVDPLSASEYRTLVERRQMPESERLPRLRTAALAALRAGTMTAAEVLELTEPAALVPAMALARDDADDRRPGERRAADDLRQVLARHASEQLGDDAGRWARAVARVDRFEGTMLELFADPDADPDANPDGDPASGRENRSRKDNTQNTLDYDAANVLLALAPRDVAERALTAEGAEPWITAAAGAGPLCRALVEHVLTRGTDQQRERLAGNAFTPDAILARLMDATADPDTMVALLGRKEVDWEIFQRAYVAASRDRDLGDWIVKQFRPDPMKALVALRSAADDPAWILSILRPVCQRLLEPVRIAAYVLLAEVAGVEAVWALEQERTETVTKAASYVRESMASGDATPLIEAARAHPLPDRRKVLRIVPLQTTEEKLDQPFARPLEHAIRTRLDGRVDRWLELADLLEAEAEAEAETAPEHRPTPYDRAVELIADWPAGISEEI
jgi:hypothetical protein